jgi:UDP-N-acetylglucosamine 1-carboxyvinyltransferase
MCRGAAFRDSRSRSRNVPRLRDVSTMAKLLAQMGVAVERGDEKTVLHAKSITDPTAAFELVKTMRAVGAGARSAPRALADRPRCRCPGGCAIGQRPVGPARQRACRRWGATISIEHGYMQAVGAPPARRAHRDGHGDRSPEPRT